MYILPAADDAAVRCWRTFDAPVFSEELRRRSATTTPLQALAMMNGNLLHDEAAHLAKRVAAEAATGRWR
jgi:hypothetical protein